MGLSDLELARGAMHGDAGCLGALLQRHHAGLLALAVSIVGRDDAEDVVHDAFLVALRHVGRLRDPGAAPVWLRTIVRTECLMRLRRRREQPVADLAERAGRSHEPTPEEELERLALGDWVWTALARLSEPLRTAAILRYFGTCSSYEEIAAILDLPVGTVRSRLSQARLRLADMLMEEAGRVHHDAARRQRDGEHHFRRALDDVNGGDFGVFADTWADDVHAIAGSGPPVVGRRRLVRELHDGTPAAGVRIHLQRVVAGPSITVLEAAFENPTEAPGHCPPFTTQVHFHPRGRTERIIFAFGTGPGHP